MITNTLSEITIQAKKGPIEMKAFACEIRRIKFVDDNEARSRRTRSGRRIYGLAPVLGAAYWTARAGDKLERRRVRSRAAQRARQRVQADADRYQNARRRADEALARPVMGTSCSVEGP